VKEMKQLFIETKYEGELELPKVVIKKLPAKIVLAMPVQFLDFVEQVKWQLEQMGKKVVLFKSKHGKHPGQILGCDVFKFSGDYDAFMYIGDGKFHPTALLYENDKPVYCYNPWNKKLELLDQNCLEKLQRRKKGQLLKFLSSENVGIMVTTKPGQAQLNAAEKLRNNLEKEGKKAFLFLMDNINFSQLENFNFIDSWVNTACPRIIEDFKCLNLRDLRSL